MDQDFLINLLVGTSFFMLGIYLLRDVLDKKKKGHIFFLGSNLTLCFASIASVILGCVLLYKALF